MIITNEIHREHLFLLRTCSMEEIGDLFERVPEIIGKNHSSEFKYTFSNDSVLIKNALDALVYLTIQSFNPSITATEFSTSLRSIGFSKEQCSRIWNSALSIKPTVINIFGDSRYVKKKFRHLEWRIESKIFSRSIYYKISPIVAIKMYFNKDVTTTKNQTAVSERSLQNSADSSEVLHVQIDINKIRHIINILEDALLSVNRQNAIPF